MILKANGGNDEMIVAETNKPRQILANSLGSFGI